MVGPRSLRTAGFVPRLLAGSLAGVLGLLAGLSGLWDASAAADEPPRLDLPIACTPGRDCWPIQYFDHDAGPGSRDYACGTRSYDGHDGTDIGLRDGTRIAEGVAVLAAAAGTVRAVRDGMPDRPFDPTDPGEAADKGCGNGVVVMHGGGWETQYCHLRRASVRVRPGQRVGAGEALGMVGMSGRSEFPHLEMILRRDGVAVDPFVGEGRRDVACGTAAGGSGAGGTAAGGGMWTARAAGALAYSPVDIIAVGVTGSMPSAERAHAGELNAETLPADSSLLAAWVTVIGVQAGDRLRLSLSGPDGRPVAAGERPLSRTQIRYFMYVGERARAAWPRGDYLARAELLRKGRGGDLVRTGEATVRVR